MHSLSMNVVEQVYALCSAFGLEVIVLIIICIRLLKDLKEGVAKLSFFICLIMQITLRCTFFVISIFLDQKRLGNFYNNFPAAVFVTLCCVLLLEWVKVATQSIIYPLTFYLIVNAFMYISIFLLFGLEVYLTPEHMIFYFSTLFCCIWVLVISGGIYFLAKTYPWKDMTQEWTDNRKSVVGGIILLCTCLFIRSILLMFGTFVYNNTYNLTDPSNPTIPSILLLIYYAVGELLASIGMIIVQLKLPAQLTKRPYGELERLINKMKKEEADYKAESLLCKICLEKETNTAFLPCRHSLACEDCSLVLNACPLCRKAISETLLLYRG